jgi:hypothetical protein
MLRLTQAFVGVEEDKKAVPPRVDLVKFIRSLKLKEEDFVVVSLPGSPLSLWVRRARWVHAMEKKD